jgi:serine protease Do
MGAVRLLSSLLCLTLPLTAVAEPKHTAPHADALWSEGSGKPGPTGVVNLPAFVKLARSLGPAVVNIVAIQNGDDPRSQVDRQLAPEGKPRGNGRGQGTGFIIHKSGLILTNAHVIDGSDDIRVRLSDERELRATAVGRDERTDLALLRIEANGPLAVAPLGNSDNVQIGEWVIAIGNPYGLDHSVTAGIVSAKGRTGIRPGREVGSAGSNGFSDYIQTDASINPGNSGGPLINARGEVIGINTAIASPQDSNNVGFAIAMSSAKPIIAALEHGQNAAVPYLGIEPVDVTPALVSSQKLDVHKGAYVSTVRSDGPAGAAGVHKGDVIVKFDGQSVSSAADLKRLIRRHQPGDKVAVVVNRGGSERTIDVTLVPFPSNDNN